MLHSAFFVYRIKQNKQEPPQVLALDSQQSTYACLQPDTSFSDFFPFPCGLMILSDCISFSTPRISFYFLLYSSASGAISHFFPKKNGIVYLFMFGWHFSRMSLTFGANSKFLSILTQQICFVLFGSGSSDKSGGVAVFIAFYVMCLVFLSLHLTFFIIFDL